MNDNRKEERDKFPNRRIKTIPGWLEAFTDTEDVTPVLKNDKIVANIISHLPRKELLKCRLVCKAWSSHATNEVAKSSLVYFNQEGIHDRGIGMQAFVQAMAKVTSPPIRRVQLVDIDLSMETVTSFFQVFGKHIKELRIELTEKNRSRLETQLFKPLPRAGIRVPLPFSKIEIRMADLRNILMFSVPNLEYLELISPSVTLSKEAVFASWYIQEMTEVSESIQGFPALVMKPSSRDQTCNMKRLRIEPSEGRRPLQWQLINDIIWASDGLREIQMAASVKILPVLNCLEELGRFCRLKKLIVGQLLTSELLMLIKASSEYGLELQHFESQFVPLEDQTEGEISYFKELLDEFLDWQKGSLKVLRLEEDAESPLQMGLPKMLNLRELKVIPILCDMPTFMSGFPCLKILSISSMNLDLLKEDRWNSLFPSTTYGDCFQTVKELELPHGMKNVLRLKTFAKNFRNVTSLTMKGISEAAILTTLWKAWPGLESLTLELAQDFGEQTDRIFTGLTVEVLEELQGIHKLKAKLRKLDSVPSVASLRKLRYLEITLNKSLSRRKYSFTDLSCELGFLIMDKLKTLLIPWSNISEDCLDELRGRDFDRLDVKHVKDGRLA